MFDLPAKAPAVSLANERTELGMFKETRENVTLEAFGLEDSEAAAVIVPGHNVVEIGTGQNGMHLGRETGHMTGGCEGREGILVRLGAVIPVVEIGGGAELGRINLGGGVEVVGGAAALPGLLLGVLGGEVVVGASVVELVSIAFGCGGGNGHDGVSVGGIWGVRHDDGSCGVLVGQGDE